MKREVSDLANLLIQAHEGGYRHAIDVITEFRDQYHTRQAEWMVATMILEYLHTAWGDEHEQAGQGQ